MRVLLFVLVVAVVVACQDTTAPRAFTLGPGCWTITTVETTLDDGRKTTVIVKAHYPVCPDSMAEGQTLWHWDTTFVQP